MPLELDLGTFGRCFVDTALVLPTDGLRGGVAQAQGASCVVEVWTGSSVRVLDAGSARARVLALEILKNPRKLDPLTICT